jgi:hypothetical protein
LNYAKKKCLAVGKPTRDQVVATLLILVKHDEMLEPQLYMDTDQQK